MKIDRITVEGGFLDGLDLTLSPGMNVLIGGRGTGKTSVIELLRFCFGARSYTDESAERSRRHALAILEDGQITVTYTVGKNTFSISRTADQEGEDSLRVLPPIIFSQTDIESLGLQASGRLRLVDSFRTRRAQGEEEDEAIIAAIQSLTTEMQELAKEIEQIETQISAKKGLEDQLKVAAENEKKVAAQSASVKKLQDDLRQVNSQLASVGVSIESIIRTGALLRAFESKIDAVIAVPPSIENWPREAGKQDLLATARSTLDRALIDIKNAKLQIKSAVEQATSLSAALIKDKAPLEAQARELRKKIDQLTQGAGEVSRTANQIREKLTQLNALVSLIDEKRARLSSVQSARGKSLDRIDSIWERRFRDRLEVSQRINAQLNPRIRVSVLRAAQLSQYASTISAALRGSGLRYAELSNTVAKKMSPRELVETVERGEAEVLAGLLEIPIERAVRILNQLRAHGMADIITTHVEDDAQLELLDGVEYKDVESLSVGQRCTVVLPIILEHKDRVLIVDQPEDHLDNAFVVDTLVKAIRGRGSESQILLSTHNANIPVLGYASQVIAMNSDGRRGFVDIAGELDSPDIVTRITDLMEGGAEAFRLRAKFYREHLATDG